MGRISIVLFLMLAASSSWAQFMPVPTDARSGAMGGCTLFDDSCRSIAVGYRSGFAMAAMSTRRIDVRWPLGPRGMAEGGFSHFGDADYHEQQASLAYRLKANGWLTVGVGGRYFRQATGDAHYEPRQWLAATAMASATLGSWVRLTATAAMRPWDDYRPWEAHVGLAYMPVERLMTLVELASEERLRLRMGMEYSYRRLFFFRAGLSTAPLTLTAGFGVHYGIYVIDLSVEHHNTLGITPQATLSLCF